MFNKKFLVFLLVIFISITTAHFGEVNIFSQPAEATETGEKYFTILHTNDIHAHVDRFPILAGKVNKIREQKAALGEPVLLTDGGDFISPTIYSWLNCMGCAPELKMMQKVGYDAVTLGNHEFDFGPEVLANLLKNAGYPNEELRPVILSSNTVPPPGHPLDQPGLFRRTHIKELDNGLRVGFLGLHGKGTIGFDLFKAGPVDFSNPYDVAREDVSKLREEGADIIVALIHDGFNRNMELAAEVSGIDIIMGGHNHRTFEPDFVNDTIVIQTSAYLENLCMMEFAYDLSDGSIRLRNNENGTPYHIPLDYSVKVDSDVADYLSYFDNKLSKAAAELTGGKFEDADETIIRSDFALTSVSNEESTMGNFAADAIRIIAGEKLRERVDFSFVASGMYWSDLGLGPGDISFRDFGDIPLTGTGPDLLPGHPLVSFYLTGEEVRRFLEVFYFVSLSGFMGDSEYPQISGFRLDYNPDRVVYLTLPFSVIDFLGDKTPVPSTRTVVKAERFTGVGLQTVNEEDYVPLDRGDEELYLVATEAYILYHLPTLEGILHIFPMMEIVPKDRDGNPIPYMNEKGEFTEDVIVYDREGNEVKAWQALVEYAAMQPPGVDGVPEMPSYYADTSGRMNEVWTLPFYVWYALVLAALVMSVIFIIRAIKGKRYKKYRAH